MSTFPRFLGLSTNDARAFAGNLQSSVAQVTQVLSELQQQTTPSTDEINAAISGSSAIENALRQFISQDTINAYGASTQDALQKILAVEKVLVDEQQSMSQHGGTGFVPPQDPSVVAQAITNWQAVLQDINAGLANTAAQIDQSVSQSSAQASAGAAAQAAAQAAAAGQTSTTSSGSTVSTPGSSTSTSSSGSTVVNPPPLPPAAIATPGSSVASFLPSMTPAAWVFVGLGGLLLVGLWTGYVDVPKALGGSPVRKKNPAEEKPRRRRARRKKGRR